MRKLMFLFIILAASLIIFGCSSTDPEPEPEVFDPPTGLTYMTYQDSVKLSWSISPDAGQSGFQGYLIYRRENAGFSGLSDTELEAYLVSSSPVSGTETTITGLASDKIHYFAARAIKVVGGDTTLSNLSGTVDTSPTIWFEDTLWEITGGASVICAIDFDNQVVYPMQLAHLTHIDLYLGVDDSNFLTLKSPSNFGTEWESRVANIKRLGIATEGLASFGDAGTIGTSTTATLTQPGTTFAIKIGSHYSKLYFVNFVGGAYPNRGIYFKAAYQEIGDYTHF